MSREIKFRAWDKANNRFVNHNQWLNNTEVSASVLVQSILTINHQGWVIMQYTGLKDKNGLTCIYECDIIDALGNIKGNIYEMDARETDTVIQGFGTKTWCETYRRAILLGCIDSE